MDEDKNVKLILGNDLYSKVSSCRILMVGAGGIGCELLKNLVLSGFKNITVVAKESALRFNPSVNIESHQADIKNTEFNVEWFKQFTMVLNALDNLDARKHVNAMCLAANIPLIESGTTGYLGQSYVINKGITECFDCHPKPTPTTYPVCTIRSTPSAPIHCIVWAKSYLFTQLFGNSEDDEALDQEKSEDNAQELAALVKETEALKKIKDSMGTPEYPKQVFDKVFKTDILRLLSMEDMWKERRKPTPLDYEQLAKGRQIELTNETVENDHSKSHGLKDQQLWTLGEYFDVFRSSVTKLSERLRKQQSIKPDAILTFDKDDEDALEFVASAANLRAKIFEIQQKTLFEVKSMAGNIIPAIATTNAIIAGVVVMKAFQVLRGSIGDIKRTYLTTVSRRPHLLIQEESSGPNLECQVCQSTGATVLVDLEKATLRDLIDKILLAPLDQGGAEMTEEIAVMDGDRMLYDIEYDDNLDTLLKDLKVQNGTILRIDSENGDQDLDLVIQSRPSLDTVIQLSETLKKTNKKNQQKRRLESNEASQQEEQIQKKPKLDNNTIVEIGEDDENGTIVLD
ncbi:uncharacterized protein BX664DRAFT_365212 [Halteromyces radiatus]|uniref:uncharacterized protein n=1 Tax=Halteromyces radiatus TaxID=101107 RepID=UPI002220DD4C|nr:uncharacterized protein BX664DRAFT_365212 [Halteromyces radiatus]KAI8088804.1 hypothetical protein BX664DRAFT_365212 [Halteromyces radiatus]